MVVTQNSCMREENMPHDMHDLHLLYMTCMTNMSTWLMHFAMSKVMANFYFVGKTLHLRNHGALQPIRLQR